MSTAVTPAEQRLLLHDISWETYERLLRESVENLGTRFTYDGGNLEIMVVSISHEAPNRTLALIAEITAEETGRDFVAAGSTTFKRRDLAKGFEPVERRIGDVHFNHQFGRRSVCGKSGIMTGNGFDSM